MLTPSDLGLPADRFPSFRQYSGFSQLDTAVAIAGSLSDKRFQLLSSPTGSGKSLIYNTVGKLLGSRTLILTVTKGLETQLYQDFSTAGLYDIRGHRNYSCAAGSYSDDGETLDLECTSRHGHEQGGATNGCGYRRAVDVSRTSTSVVTNYAHWISLAKVEDPDRLGKFDLLVCDEAHLVHDLLVDQIAIDIDRRYVQSTLNLSIPADLSLEAWGDWARNAYILARQAYKDRRGRISSRDLSRLTHFGKELARLLSACAGRDRSPWIVERTPTGARILPVWGRDYAERYLFRGVPRILLSSATLLESDGPLLGAPTQLSDFHEVESSFPAQRRPFIYLHTAPKICVDRRMSLGETRMMVNRVDRIIESRPTWKGIVHSRSYEHARTICSLSKSPRLLTHDPKSARTVIRQFIDSRDPLVLVSPAVEEGYDFKDNLARFQFLWKVPFIYGGSDLIRARVAADKGYVNYLAQRSILQAYGRIVRSTSDWGETYIGDGNWAWFRKKVKWPRYFRAAWVQTSDIPAPLSVR